MTEEHPEYTCPTSGLTGYQLYSFIWLSYFSDKTQRDRDLRAEVLEELHAYGEDEQEIRRRILPHIDQCRGCQEEYTLNCLLREGLQQLREKTLRERVMEAAEAYAKRSALRRQSEDAMARRKQYH